MDRETGRGPTRGSRVAHGAIRRKHQGKVVRVGTSVVIRCVTACASIRGIVVIPMVTSITIVGNGDVRSSEWINCVVVKIGRYPGCF